jgi:hypothetical protein
MKRIIFQPDGTPMVPIFHHSIVPLFQLWAKRTKFLFEIRFGWVIRPWARDRRARRRLRFSVLRFACFKIDKAKRHQYSTFDVGRSMFDVQSVHCSSQAEFHSVLRGLEQGEPDFFLRRRSRVKSSIFVLNCIWDTYLREKRQLHQA